MKNTDSQLLISMPQRLAAIAVGIVFGLVAFSFIWVIHESEQGIYRASLKGHVVERASALRSRLEKTLNARLHLVDGLTAYVQSGNTLSSKIFEALAKSMIIGQKDIRALELAPDAVIRFIYPLVGNEKAIGLDLLRLTGQSKAVARTINKKQFILAGPLDLVQGGRGLIGRKPIFVSDGEGEKFWGFAIIIIDFDALLFTAGWRNDSDIIFALRGQDSQGSDGSIFHGPKDVFTRGPVLQDISLPSGSWQLAAAPSIGWDAEHPMAMFHKIIAVVAFIFTAFGAYVLMRLYIQRTLAYKALFESEKKYRKIIETTNAISWEMNLATWRFTYVSPHAVELLGYPLEDWFSENFWPEHLHSDDREEATTYCINASKKGMDHDFEYRMIAADGSIVWLRDIVTVDAQSGDAGFLRGAMIDITENKLAAERINASLVEKEVLLQEIHHRVKNNLQVVSSMLSLQASAEKDDKISVALLEGERRVRVMARVHENLYQSDDLASVNTAKYLEGIINDLRHNYNDRINNISVEIEVDDIALKLDQAIPIGKIGSELISNAFKHAFPDERHGDIKISFKRGEDDQFIFCVADNGVGLPADFELNASNRLGMQLVHALAQKLGGSVAIERKNGTRVSLVFKEDLS